MGLRDDQVEIPLSELVELCAVDDQLYSTTFFPKTVRQNSPPFHLEMDKALNGAARFVAMEIFRGGAKTTKLRLYLSKRIAYGISYTIVVVGKSQDHAKRTVRWLRRQVEWNSKWAGVFNLSKGSKWTDEECEVVHGVDGRAVTLVALGITGSTRGINIDDYRPDLILIDDVCDEENTLTPDQREKTDDFINGSLRNSLAPSSECASAKMVFLQTPLNEDDSIDRCKKDPGWKFLRFSCFNSRGESQWPERWSTEELQAEKASLAARGKLHLWMREMECKIISAELSSFRAPLRFYDVLPEDCTFYMAIDPVPPPSDRELQRGLKGKDWEVQAVIARKGRKFFLAEYTMNRGHDPDQTVAKFFELKATYNPIRCEVESISYQRTLKWLLEKAMAARGIWMQVGDGSDAEGKMDRRKKSYRIIDTIGSAVASGNFYILRSHTEFIEQYTAYPNTNHDDVIEAVAMGLNCAMRSGGVYEGSFEEILESEKDIPNLEFCGACP